MQAQTQARPQLRRPLLQNGIYTVQLCRYCNHLVHAVREPCISQSVLVLECPNPACEQSFLGARDVRTVSAGVVFQRRTKTGWTAVA